MLHQCSCPSSAIVMTSPASYCEDEWELPWGQKMCCLSPVPLSFYETWKPNPSPTSCELRLCPKEWEWHCSVETSSGKCSRQIANISSSSKSSIQRIQLSDHADYSSENCLEGPEPSAFIIQGLACFILTVASSSHSIQIHQPILSYRGWMLEPEGVNQWFSNLTRSRIIWRVD